uniref:Protein kinase domain-containing protein n=1 Tax=Junco hyemalis TaxID=40217 RepID=A0A8C5J4H4_JUNHY
MGPPVASGMLWGSLSPMASSPQGFGKGGATYSALLAYPHPAHTSLCSLVLQEYEILKALHHERIMALHEAYITPRYLVLICENCAGKEILYSIVDRYRGAQGHRGQWLVWGYLLMAPAPRFRYSEDDVVSYVLQLLQGLEYLHGRRIVHLDIKPDNIIVSGTNALKIIDFGSAQTYNPLVLRQLGRRAGTLEYMCEWSTTGVVAWGQGQNWVMLIAKGVHVCLCSGGLGNGKELCPWGRWEAFGVLGVSVNFYSIAGVSGAVGLLGYPWSRTRPQLLPAHPNGSRHPALTMGPALTIAPHTDHGSPH